MGLFDVFRRKKRRQKQDVAKALAVLALLEHANSTRADAVDSDDLPSAFGSFGLCATNPIPTRSILGSYEYLANLRTDDGQPVKASRVGSTTAPEVTEAVIDVYALSVGGLSDIAIYICPYHKKNSMRAPEGFVLQ